MCYLPLYLADFVVKTVWLPIGGVWVDHSLRVSLVEELCVVELHAVDCGDLPFVEPLDSFSVFPKSELYFAVLWNKIGAEPVLFASKPVALVATTVCPSVDSVAMLFVVFILALVHSTVIPNVDACAFHIIFQPLSLIPTSIEPRVHTNSADLVLTPIPSVLTTIVPLVGTNSMLPSESILTLILTFVSPGFNPLAML